MTQAGYTGNAPALQANLSESDFQAQVLDMAATLGWTHRYHALYAIGSDRGYPDLTLAHPEKGVVWMEIKGPAPKVYEAQVAWLETLQTAGQHAYLVYPTDYDIVATLLQDGNLGTSDRKDLIANQYRYTPQPFRRKARGR